MEELFSKDIDPRKTKGMQINSVRAQVENRIALDKKIQALPHIDLKCCNICGSEDQTNVKFSTNGKDWVECPECTHVYKKSIPRTEDLIKYFSGSTVEVYLNESNIKNRLDNITRPKYDFMMKHYQKKPGRWLDLATGIGDMPHLAKNKGWDVDSTELNKSFVSYARETLGVNCQEKTLFEYYDTFKSQGMEKFDVIGGFGYYDMLDSPVEHCQAINKMLKMGGLHGINLPNHDSLSGKLVEWKPNSSLRKATPVDISCYNMNSINKMLSLSGFEARAVLWHGLDIHELIVRMIELDSSFKDTKACKFLYDNFNSLQKVVDSQRQSDLLLVCAQKVKEI